MLTFPSFFFIIIKVLDIKDLDAMLIMHMTAFQSAGIHFPTPSDFSRRMNLTENEVSMILQRLNAARVSAKLLKVKMQHGVLFETFSLQPLWDRLVDHIALASNEVGEGR